LICNGRSELIGAARMNNFGVIGAGLMGSEIALIHALSGNEVLLGDRSDDLVQAALSRLQSLLDKGVTRGFYTSNQIEPTLKKIRVTSKMEDFSSCDYITEAITEDPGAKIGLLTTLDEVCRENCIFASNTSTIPISTLAAKLRASRQKRVIGTHYFSPVSRMKLVEVIPGFCTDDRTTEVALEHCRQLGKQPILVKDVAGFAINRMLHAFIIEAVRLVEENVASPADIDLACRLGLGHAMGPFELMDQVTSTLCVQAQEIMHDAYGERFRPPPLLKQRVAAGFVGGKGKPGWKATKSDP
jgi:3-hydroxybutyryl-CoA dehydrogenase